MSQAIYLREEPRKKKSMIYQSRFYFLAVVLLLSLSSCSKNLSYFSSSLAEENSWGEHQLKQIQFYVSQDIHLYRTASGGSSEIKDGRIEIKDERKVDEIVIKRGTPGILTFMPKEDRYAISFDDSGAYLVFGPGQKTKGRFTLRAKSWNDKKGTGIVTYGDTEYKTTVRSAYAALMVDVKKASKSQTRSKTASGVKVK